MVRGEEGCVFTLFLLYAGSVCGGLCWDGCAFCDLALFFKLFEFGLGFFELSLEGRVGVKSGDCHRACDTSGIDIALEMITADDAAFAHLISAFEDFVLALRVNLGEDQCGCPSDGCMA